MDKQQLNGTWLYERIGPHNTELRINGPSADKVMVGAYINVEDQNLSPEWQNWNRDRKLQIHTGIYQPEAGLVHIYIRGYDKDGEKEDMAEDDIILYIDNTWTGGDIDYVKMGADDPGECALFEIPSPGQPLTVRYRVTDPEGFMERYALNVYRGSNTHVPTKNPATNEAVSFSYNPAVSDRFSGTLDETADPTGYVEISLIPAGADNSWLANGVDFCAFSFELSAKDRKTNGYSNPGNRILWRELVGISYEWP